MIALASLLPGHPLHAAAFDPGSLAQRIEELAFAGGAPAVGLAVFSDAGEPLVWVWGAGIHRNTPFRWGSVTKIVTALTLLDVAESADIDLATLVASVLSHPPCHNPWETTHPVRVRDLLELTAGFADLTRAQFDFNEPLPLREALEHDASHRRTLWPPGRHHSYSNFTPGVSAAVIEQVSGRAFEEVVRERVFVPVGMPGSGFAPDPGLPGGFRMDGSTPISYWHMTYAAFGALNAPLPDLARLGQALLAGGRVGGRQVLRETAVERLFRAEASLGGRAGLPLAYAAGSYGWISHGQVFRGHGGDADGFRSRLGLLHAASRGYALAVNVDNPALIRRLAAEVEQALTLDLEPMATPPAPVLAPAELERLAGRYYPATERFRTEQWMQGGAEQLAIQRGVNGLVLEYHDRQTVLVPVDSVRFRRTDDPLATFAFVVDDGELFLEGDFGAFRRIDPSDRRRPTPHQ